MGKQGSFQYKWGSVSRASCPAGWGAGGVGPVAVTLTLIYRTHNVCDGVFSIKIVLLYSCGQSSRLVSH